MSPEKTLEFTKDVIVGAMRLVVNGSEIHRKTAVSAIDKALDNFRPFADKLDEIPIIIIAADKFRHKGKDGWPAWDRIACCNFADIADHPWSPRCAQAKGDQGKRTESATSDVPNTNVNVAERAPVKREDPDKRFEDQDEARWTDTLTSKRNPVKPNVDAQRGRQQQTTTAPAPRPSCSTCLSRGTPCVANVSGACKGCRARKKRCDHVVRKEGWSSPPVMSIKPAKRAWSQSRGRTATLNGSVSSPLPSPPTKRQRRQTVAPSEESKDIPATVKSGPPKGAKRVQQVHLAPRTVYALPSASAPNLPSPSGSQRASSVKQAAVVPSNPSSSQADLRPGRMYSLRGEPLVTRDEVVHLDDQQHTLMARTEKLEKLYDDMITRADKFREQQDAMTIQMEDLTRGMVSALHVLQKYVGGSPSAGDACR